MKKKTDLNLIKSESDFARKLINEAVHQNKPEELGAAVMILWAAIDKIITYLEKNENKQT